VASGREENVLGRGGIVSWRASLLSEGGAYRQPVCLSIEDRAALKVYSEGGSSLRRKIIEVLP